MKSIFTEIGYKKDPRFKLLCEALAKINDPKQVAEFLRDVGTLGELQEWSERLDIAKKIMEGSNYRTIAEKTGASTATVTRVNKFLLNGKGYQTALKKVGKHHRPISRDKRSASAK